ncbi:MAG: 3-keto-5-aminohexanoate cleavage protein [Flavobacteriaceae bacterium]|nr:MAG: 3-keto-5-aminohexanoate cleavage protein [Flavobacteriaceae bacterium]
MDSKLIVNFTPTGMIPTKSMTPHVPITVDEIVEDVRKAHEIGITMVHLHAREEDSGEPTFKKEIYGEIIGGIREFAPDLVICVSLSGRNFKDFKQRADPLFLKGHLKPDMGSLTLSSLNFNRAASMNAPTMVMDLARTMKENGIVPELEAFDVGMINYAKYLENKGLLEAPYYFNLLLGNIACAQANLLHAGMMINELPEDSLWSMAGIGNAQLKMNSVAIATGGGVRVGIEDNIWFDSNRTKLASNSDLVKRIHVLMDANERKLMSSGDFRKRLKLKEGYGKYGR